MRFTSYIYNIYIYFSCSHFTEAWCILLNSLRSTLHSSCALVGPSPVHPYDFFPIHNSVFVKVSHNLIKMSQRALCKPIGVYIHLYALTKSTIYSLAINAGYPPSFYMYKLLLYNIYLPVYKLQTIQLPLLPKYFHCR